MGVALSNEAKAYPFSRLNVEPVVNDVLGGQPVLVVFDADSATGAVFDREVDGRMLDFRLETSGGLTDMRVVDE